MQTLQFSYFNVPVLIRRSAAQVIDMLLVWVICIPLIAIPFIGRYNFEFYPSFYITLLIVYGASMDAFLGGTVGKMALSLRVVNESSRRSALISSLYRNLLKYVLMYYVWGVLLVVGKQGVHNRITGCAVVDAGKRVRDIRRKDEIEH